MRAICLVPKGANDYLVDAANRGFTGSAKASGHTREILQFQRNMFENMAWPGSFFEPAQKTAALFITATMFN